MAGSRGPRVLVCGSVCIFAGFVYAGWYSLNTVRYGWVRLGYGYVRLCTVAVSSVFVLV